MEGGDVLNSEAVDRMVWDVPVTGASAISGAGSSAASGWRLGSGQAPINTFFAVDVVGAFFGVGAAGVLGSGTLDVVGRRLGVGEVMALGAVAIWGQAWRVLSSYAVLPLSALTSATSRLRWTWTQSSADSWVEQAVSKTGWTEQVTVLDPWTNG